MSCTAECRASGGHTEQEHGDCGEEQRGLPREPETHRRADHRHLDPARQLAQHERAHAGDQQHADECLQARQRARVFAQRREQAEQDEAAADRECAGVRRESSAGAHEEEGRIEHRPSIRERTQRHELQREERHGEDREPRREPRVPPPRRGQQQQHEERQQGGADRETPFLRVVPKRLRLCDQGPRGEERFVGDRKDHRALDGRGGACTAVGEPGHSRAARDAQVERPAETVGGRRRVQQHGRHRTPTPLARDRVQDNVERGRDDTHRPRQRIDRHDEPARPRERPARLGKHHGTIVRPGNECLRGRECQIRAGG